ncbi:MAG TPA: 3'(2'),5'-bisphosphate nucleotidase CysQ [Candidatus Binataceae bacterium]|nr:3'(2'),5'-bisphosphate nucleotidase CysQ [Candidatus Binataceae bacterium]
MSTYDESAPQQTAADAENYFRELELAKSAASAAGEILRGYYQDRGFTIDQKGKDNPVTTADFAADRKLKEMLRDGFPAYGWLSEETADDGKRLQCRRAWIVDPLDGTKEFIKGVPEFVVAIALTDNGVPVMGVSYNPIKNEMFSGIVGAGCWFNDHPAHTTATRSLESAVILASRSETSRGEWKSYEGKVIIKPVGSVAYKLALVAVGQADATFTRSPKSEWDIAAGTALIISGGGRVSDSDGKELRFNKASVRVPGMVGSNGHLHEPIERLLGHYR